MEHVVKMMYGVKMKSVLYYFLSFLTVCEDIDECKVGFNECTEWADCQNTFGSNTCNCKPGYFGNGRQSCFSKMSYIFPETETLNSTNDIMSEYFISGVHFTSCVSANERCKSQGALLASFETVEEWNFMVNKLYSEFENIDR